MTAQTQTAQTGDKNQPTHLVKVRHGQGKGAHYERIGVAWENPQTGSLYVKLHGVQIVDQGFSLYPIDQADERGAQ